MSELEEEDSSQLLVSLDPQVTSSDSAERKLARQNRIVKRNEAALRVTNDGDHLPDIVSDKTELEKQVEASAEELERLLLEGKELVTNVRVASDTREVNRRQEETDNRKKRLQRLEDEETVTKTMFEEVQEKWEMMAKQNDPMDLKSDIDAQKERCNELLEQKNAVIRDLMAELDAADSRFITDQQRQLQEVSLLVQRIENQVKIMQEAYRRELVLIEEAINNERKELLDSCNKQWDSLYKQRDKEESNNLKLHFQEQEDQDEDVKRLRMEHQEKYRQTKIKLDSDIQVMHHELEQVKAMCLLNAEKLDYNYQVLQKREDENLMMRAQQKRRINRLQDIANSLRKKMRESEAAAEIETVRLHEEITRLHQNIGDIEKKANHFANINDRRYQQVWNLRQETANKLLSKIMTIDRLIHEQQLGLEWTAPENILLDKEDLQSYQAAVKLVYQVLEPKEENLEEPGDTTDSPKEQPECSDSQLDEGGEKKEVDVVLKELSRRRLFKLVLQRVADSAGFLVEERLRDLLAPYSESQKTIICLDNVFNALGLRHEKDIEMLRDYFLPYATCTLCTKPGSDNKVSSVTKGLTTDENVPEVQTSETQDEDVLGSEHATVSSVLGSSDPSIRKFKDTSSSKADGSRPSLTQYVPCGPPDKICCDLHPLEIDPVYVLQALRSFISNFQQNKLGDLKSIAFLLSQKRNTISRLLSVEDVSKFWHRYQKAFPKKREQLWEGFLIALNKYHTILAERHKLNNEAKALARQNEELRRLLNSYMKNKLDGKRQTKDTLPPLFNRKVVENNV
ncbi:dynein regulatory complex protein 1 [Thrips palmi]|uniref:Dynein regulatory complex protein 1 n=1 Tax=Thrips palmi TaxID=161013 RepID=A0A6P8Z4H9_THRPL|nr:dynein regulatory complex protein 1 [Thrips palmi]XP_034241505.1 dynein regulatory complex protein 1 [Thrips palmi]